MRAFAVRDFGQVPALIQRMGPSVLLIAGGEGLPVHFASSMVPLVWTGWRLC